MKIKDIYELINLLGEVKPKKVFNDHSDIIRIYNFFNRPFAVYVKTYNGETFLTFNEDFTKEIKRKSIYTFNENDFLKKLENLIYEKYNVEFSKIQIIPNADLIDCIRYM